MYDSLQSIPCHPNEDGDLHEWDPGPSLHLYFYLPPRKAALVISNVLKSKVSLPNISSHHFLSVNVWRINWCESTQWKRNKVIYIPMLKKMSFFCQTPLTSFLVCWKFISESQDDCSPHSEWTGEPVCPAQSIVYLLAPRAFTWQAPYNVNGSFCTPWRSHFIPCLGHNASRASRMLPMRLLLLNQCRGAAGRSLPLCSV